SLTKVYIFKNQEETMPSKSKFQVASDVKKRKCGSLFEKWLKLLSAILLPLAISVFTVVQTIQENNIAFRQREQEQRQADELQRDTIFAAYIKEMGELFMNKGRNVSEQEMIERLVFARAKTLAALRQIDLQRKTYLIQFLYEACLLDNRKYPIDLSGADLSGISLSGKSFKSRNNLDYLYLPNVNLIGASFSHTYLTQADFHGSIMTSSNFTDAYLHKANFTYCQLDGIDFSMAYASTARFQYVNLTGAFRPPLAPIWHSIVSNGAYVDIFLPDNSTLIGAFNNVVRNGDAEADGTCPTNMQTHQLPSQWYYPSNFSSIINCSILAVEGNCCFWGGKKIV
ncbi:unnamed protein product, partial [Didymodactylos carnosus]